VVHEIEVMGEATKRLDKDFKNSHQQIEWGDLKGMRDRLIHAYNLIDYAIVWSTVTNDIPVLIRYLKKLLEEEA
ncbi:DUF86 domain-containing protein, partial [bacterium]|nr:DUF86 domain-containing protein [bacterium]